MTSQLGKQAFTIHIFPNVSRSKDDVDGRNSEINPIFLIKPFFYMNKKSRQSFKYPQKEKSF